MKNKIITTFFLILILLNFTYSVKAESIEKNLDAIKNPNEIIQDIKNTTKGIDLNFANNEKIPDKYSRIPKALFGVKGEITISELIIYASILILIFLIVHQIVQTTSFSRGAISITISILISLIIGILEIIPKASTAWISLLSKINVLKKMGSWTISFLIASLLVLYVLLAKFLSTRRESIKLMKAAYHGTKSGGDVLIAKKQAEIIQKTSS